MLQEESEKEKSEKEKSENSAAATCKLSFKEEAVSDVISLAYFKVMCIYYRYIQYILWKSVI